MGFLFAPADRLIVGILRDVWAPERPPKVIVTDREKALRNAIANHFPEAENNVCLWHIDQNIRAACYGAFAAVPGEYEVFKKKWHTVMYSRDEDAYEDAWGKLQLYLADRASVLDYLIKNIIPDRELFMRPWIGQTAHLGNNTTARGESAHSWLKKHVNSHKKDMASVFEKIADTVDYQVTSIVTEISNEKQKGKSGIPECLRPLNTKVSIHAIVMLEQQWDLYQKNRDAAAKGVELDECTGSLWATMGVPCWHMLVDILDNKGVVETTDIHDQWKLYYDPEDPVSQCLQLLGCRRAGWVLMFLPTWTRMRSLLTTLTRTMQP